METNEVRQAEAKSHSETCLRKDILITEKGGGGGRVERGGELMS